MKSVTEEESKAGILDRVPALVFNECMAIGEWYQIQLRNIEDVEFCKDIEQDCGEYLEYEVIIPMVTIVNHQVFNSRIYRVCAEHLIDVLERVGGIQTDGTREYIPHEY